MMEALIILNAQNLIDSQIRISLLISLTTENIQRNQFNRAVAPTSLDTKLCSYSDVHRALEYVDQSGIKHQKDHQEITHPYVEELCDMSRILSNDVHR